ncbi:AI-2E family transporter [Petrimonas sp.]|uniref:AI-2E family transporter n=1 Tax=Petrimonas sp. TaxID=2023866 RepID=UPI003F511A8C
MIENGIPAKKKEYKYILIGFLVLLGFILFKELRMYLSGFLGAATLYVLLKGQMVYLVEKRKWKKGPVATLLTLLALLLFLGPLTGLAFLVADTISGISINPKEIIDSINNFIKAIEERLDFDIFTPENLASLPKIGGNILQSLGTGIYSLLINSLFALFILFYMLYHYDGFEKMVKEILPFKEENKQILGEETKLIIKANAIGIPLLAAIQGVFAYFGYVFFGVDNAVLYAILTGAASIIPILGTTVVWVPIALAIFLEGNIGGGIGMSAYGLIIIGGVDNVARFLLQKWLADIHPLITIFGVLIGIPMFGFWGVIFGPLLLSLFVLFFNMYRHEYIPGSSAEPRVTTRMKSRKLSIPSYHKNKKQ